MALASGVLAFEDFRINVRTRELLRVGTDGSAVPVALGSRATDLLLLFLSRPPGELVTKNEILEAVWPNATVEDSNLSAQIAGLRRALDAGRSGAGCIQTVPGRGYRFIPQVIDLVEPQSILPAFAARTSVPAPIESTPEPGAHLPEHPAPSSLEAASAPPVLTPSGAGKSAKWALIGVAAAATLAAGTVVAVLWRGNAVGPLVQSSERPAPPKLSIAVLPFVNSGSDQQDDELPAALTDDFTMSLAQIPGSHVVARSMAQAMAARRLPLPSIGGELGVRYLLEGNTRESPNGVELRVQLNDASSGASIWVSQFQVAGRGLSDLRSQIAQDALFPLRTVLMDAEARRLSNLPAAAVTADDLLLQVRAANNHPYAPATSVANIALLERALALEPASPEIMIALARELILPPLNFDERDGRDARLRRARALAERARTLVAGSDPMLELQAMILQAEGRMDEAVAAYTALLQARPQSVAYRTDLALPLIQAGRSAEAVPLLRDAITLNRGEDNRFPMFQGLGRALLRLGQYDEAIYWLRKAREQSSGSSPTVGALLAIAYAHTGKLRDARRELQEYLKQRPGLTLSGLRHTAWPNPAIAEEMKPEIEGFAIAGLRDHAAEDEDFGLPITEGLRSTDLDAPTPIGAGGVSTIHTSELRALIDRQANGGLDDAPALVLSTLCTVCLDVAFPGAAVVPSEYVREPLSDEERQALKAWVDRLLSGNQTRRLITLSWNPERWHARNLALELASLGYPNVSWYRGGLEAWDAAGLPVCSQPCVGPTRKETPSAPH